MDFIGNDYKARIIDKAGIIPDDEPCFLFRAKDQHCAQTLRHYAWLCEKNGNHEQAEKVYDFILKIENYQDKKGRKAPDIPVQTKMQL